MVNALGQISTSGTPVRNLKKKKTGACVYECHSRQATPEEIERYFGMAKKIKPGKPVSPTAGVPEETQDSRRVFRERILMLEELRKAASEVTEKQYKTMKAAVMIIEKVNGYGK